MIIAAGNFTEASQLSLPPDFQEKQETGWGLTLASQPAKSLDTRFASEHVDVLKAQTFASWLLTLQGALEEKHSREALRKRAQFTLHCDKKISTQVQIKLQFN